MAIFHGQWNTLDDLMPEENARVALARFDLSNPLLDDPATPADIRAEAALWRGEAQKALLLLATDGSAHAAVLKAEACWLLGRLPQAAAVLEPWRQRLRESSITGPAELTDAARAVVMLGHLEGSPSQDYQFVMELLGKAHQEIDRLYWPAKLSEAELLLEKDNGPEAGQAALEALSLNPRAGMGWYVLGRLTLDGYDFERAAAAIAELRKINSTHLLADLLEARMYLLQKDAQQARTVIDAVLARYPAQPEALALGAAAAALAFDETRFQQTLAEYDRLFPGNPMAHYTAGEYLSTARQYPAADKHLREAIRRDPNWPAPRLHLGLMLMQSGDEPAALAELRQAAELDPFQKAVQNQLKLVEAMQAYATIRTEHFVIKYHPGIDEALARDMPDRLEAIYRDITAIYGFKPPAPTQIQIMQDKQWFAVRITGMPDIWTVAACTGDVIACVPPREGPKLDGPYDWETVFRHEFVHVVTLNQTGFRIPHWFTEALAVSQEPNERDYPTHQMLAAALNDNTLFDLDAINWAFVRPKEPNDRALAYAQSHWMVQYITEAYGHQAILKMLDLYREGHTNKQAIETTTRRTADQYFEDFKSWAARQVQAWGLGRQPDDVRLDALLASSGEDHRQMLDMLLSAHPNHPDLVRLAAEAAIESGDYPAARQAVLRYAEARPVDPWSSAALVTLAIQNDRAGDAVGPMERLDRLELHSAVWSRQRAELLRAMGRLDEAAATIARGIAREPYNATLRELAAAIAMQRGQEDTALHHVQAMTLLEPERSIQWVRLAALHQRMGKNVEAEQAAIKAREIDPDAQVERFLRSPAAE